MHVPDRVPREAGRQKRSTCSKRIIIVGLSPRSMPSYDSEFKSVLSEVRAHEKWFSESLPMIASENLASEPVRRVLSSDLGHRYAEGWPGERVYAGCRYIDRIELDGMSCISRLPSELTNRMRSSSASARRSVLLRTT